VALGPSRGGCYIEDEAPPGPSIYAEPRLPLGTPGSGSYEEEVLGERRSSNRES
jgi:hypothetical protein